MTLLTLFVRLPLTRAMSSLLSCWMLVVCSAGIIMCLVSELWLRVVLALISSVRECAPISIVSFRLILTTCVLKEFLGG